MMRISEDPSKTKKYISEDRYRRVIMNLNLGAVFVGYSYTYFNAVDFGELATIFEIPQ